MLTAARTGETTGARWSEIDLEARLWTVPAERMKAGVKHRVPLSAEALRVVQRMHNYRLSEFVWPGERQSRSISAGAMLKVLDRMGFDVTVHGFRSTFRDWASERTDHDSDSIEMALAHTVGNKVEAAYRRGDLLEKRRALMEDWGRFAAG